MKHRTLVLTIALISVIFVSLFLAIDWFKSELRSTPGFFVGVELAYGDGSDYKDLVDKVRNYTNLFVVGLPETSLNQTLLNATCDYVYEAGLSFIVLFTDFTKYDYNPYVWIIKARQKYGAKFLGTYVYDEPGGNQLDKGNRKLVLEATNYTDAAESYVDLLYRHVEYFLYAGSKVFTADYGLYWFDYKAGFDTVLTEFGWNHSRQLNVGLSRGAAKVQNKDWGAIITWTYNGTPYIETADELYDDMVLAYHAGAEYVVVFDYPKILPYGILTEEHFDALKRFWDYVNNAPEKHGTIQGEVAYVLPKDYGFGFRSSRDTIWGLWKADELSDKIWGDINLLLEEHGSRLDIIYDDPGYIDTIKTRYDKLIFWN